MTPEAAHYLGKARDLLRQAEIMISAGLPEAAGRTAYLAGFHAAQGMLFETTGKIFKTHKGVQGEFARVMKDDPRFDPEKRAFLGRTFELKSIADYEVGPDSKITREQADEAIAAARLFVAHLAEVLDEGKA